jgi:hypothetical protein
MKLDAMSRVKMKDLRTASGSATTRDEMSVTKMERRWASSLWAKATEATRETMLAWNLGVSLERLKVLPMGWNWGVVT